ncbi:MAG: methyltransferase domain-containing protein [Planctomycetes bacterium]|nr:methyltransferase domain-containing protein [Planctomycetota bacterium]MBI3846849.1 methyltransferase domain-containing protein [Planctomycetota bacterium]
MKLVPPRSHEPEILDRADNSYDELAEALADIQKVNRFLGGTPALVRALRAIVEEEGLREFTVLDVGTGSADIPRAIVRFAHESGRRVRVVALDRNPLVVAFAWKETRRIPEITLVVGDAFRLPVAVESFDFVIASMFLHHFPHAEATTLLRGFDRASRRAVLVNDLARNRIPWLFIRVVGALLRRSPMFRNDAPLSVLRGFTTEELAAAARDGGLGSANVTRRFPYRVVLVSRKRGG